MEREEMLQLNCCYYPDVWRIDAEESWENDDVWDGQQKSNRQWGIKYGNSRVFNEQRNYDHNTRGDNCRCRDYSKFENESEDYCANNYRCHNNYDDRPVNKCQRRRCFCGLFRICR